MRPVFIKRREAIGNQGRRLSASTTLGNFEQRTLNAEHRMMQRTVAFTPLGYNFNTAFGKS